MTPQETHAAALASSMSTPASVETLLAEHRFCANIGKAEACTCGWEDGFVPDAIEAHRAHLAAVLAQHFGGLLTTARGEWETALLSDETVRRVGAVIDHEYNLADGLGMYPSMKPESRTLARAALAAALGGDE
jgi:hypothetical protein